MRFIYMPTFASTKQQLHSHIAIQCVPKGQVSSKSHTPNPLMLKLQDLLGHYNLSHGPDTTRFSVGIRTALPWQGETMILRTCGTCQNNTGLSVCQIWLDPKNQLCTTKTLIIPGYSGNSWRLPGQGQKAVIFGIGWGDGNALNPAVAIMSWTHKHASMVWHDTHTMPKRCSGRSEMARRLESLTNYNCFELSILWVLQFCIATTTCSIFHLLTHSLHWHLSAPVGELCKVQCHHSGPTYLPTAPGIWQRSNLPQQISMLHAIHAISVLSWKDLHR